MDPLSSSPPAAARADLAASRTAIGLAGIQRKGLDRNVLVATWNIGGSAGCQGTRPHVSPPSHASTGGSRITAPVRTSRCDRDVH
jgi:hypothetical protein